MNREQARRAFALGIILLAAAMIAREVLKRGQGRELLDLRRGSPTIDGERFSLVAPKLRRGDRTRLLEQARRLFEGSSGTAATTGAEEGEVDGRRIVLLSLGRGDRPALVVRGEGPSLSTAIAAAAESLAGRASAAEIRDGLLKLDLATSRSRPEVFDGEGRATIDRSLEGLWLPAADLLLLPEELLARRLITSEGDLQSGRLRRYLAEGVRIPIDIDGNPGKAGMPYFRVSFDSIVESSGGAPKRLFRGNDLTPEISPESLLEAARRGGDYLLRHQNDDGTFGYSYEPKSDEYNDDYNLLRHAGTCYALVELHQASADDRYLTAARRGMEWLWTKVREPKPEDAGAGFAAVVSPGEEAKLGGAALALLALVQIQKAGGDGALVGSAWDGQLPRLARFLLFQQGDDGRFVSKYFYGEPDPEPFESIYYPGEAILALMRLHQVDRQPRWLAAARRGADWLIDVRDSGKSAGELPHDHWLLMALEELHDRTGDERYLDHAERIAGAIVAAQRTRTTPDDWAGTFYEPPRSTPTATRGEALVAMYRLAARNGRETRPYLEALLRMAAFQRRCQLTPESVLYLPRPDRALGGFRRSLTDWEVRIDYVQHNLSALLGLRSILLDL
ncbi:MAG: beta-L-arabinofuranosidase domain-containing protein [Thermoanaerobaculia bacterium]